MNIKLDSNVHLNDPSLVRTQAFIDGAWVHGDSGETFPVSNPATGEDLILRERRVVTFKCSGKLRNKINGIEYSE